MPKSEDKDSKERKPRKGVYLSDIALKEITEVLTHYDTEQKIELIEHLQQIFKEIAEYYKTNNEESIYRGYSDRQQQLLKKYGKLFKPFANKRFDNYFDFNRILSIKNYYTAEEYNQLESNEDLIEQDIYELTTSMRNFLDGELHFLYLDREPQFSDTESDSREENDKESTEMQQLLALHYLLKAGFEIQARGSNSVSDMTQLAHMLLGKKFTNLQNSSIYKKYKKLPNFDSPSQLVKDLKHIRPYFEKLDLQSIVDLINKDLKTAESDKKNAKK
ncbi:MAG: hypothetical protein Q7W13_16650 [Bacteroidia bacterium]|nr:hypothetical protein [Bacteroidia bacterium]